MKSASKGATPASLETENTQPTAAEVERAMQRIASPERADSFAKFIQAIPGGYGEGDQCLGIAVPEQRKIAAQYAKLSLEELEKLLVSPWHECRLAGVFILVRAYEKAARSARRSANPSTKNSGNRKPKKSGVEASEAEATPKAIVDFYLANLQGINNWDLVDSSAYKILGDYLVDRPKERKILMRLAKSKNLWRERIAVVATLSLIKHDDFDETLELSNRFLHHEHDLMHKAVGWMLRELGKRSPDLLRGFLNQHATTMPRTMLRYSIEKMSRKEREHWLKV